MNPIQTAKPDSLNLDDVAQMLHENNQKLLGLNLQARAGTTRGAASCSVKGQRSRPAGKPTEGRPPLAVLIRDQQGMIEELEKTLYALRENISSPNPRAEPLRQTGHPIAALG